MPIQMRSLESAQSDPYSGIRQIFFPTTAGTQQATEKAVTPVASSSSSSSRTDIIPSGSNVLGTSLNVRQSLVNRQYDEMKKRAMAENAGFPEKSSAAIRQIEAARANALAAEAARTGEQQLSLTQSEQARADQKAQQEWQQQFQEKQFEFQKEQAQNRSSTPMFFPDRSAERQAQNAQNWAAMQRQEQGQNERAAAAGGISRYGVQEGPLLPPSEVFIGPTRQSTRQPARQSAGGAQAFGMDLGGVNAANRVLGQSEEEPAAPAAPADPWKRYTMPSGSWATTPTGGFTQQRTQNTPSGGSYTGWSSASTRRYLPTGGSYTKLGGSLS